MGYCVSCAKDVKTGKFCPTCGRQLLTAQELKAEVSSANQNFALVQNNKSTKAMLAHLAPLLAGPIVFIIGMFLFPAFFALSLPGLLIRNSSKSNDFEKLHGTESLNFQLTLLVPGFIVYLLSFANLVLIPLGFSSLSLVQLGIAVFLSVSILIVVGIAALIFMILGAIAGYQGREYRYPLSIRFVK